MRIDRNRSYSYTDEASLETVSALVDLNENETGASAITITANHKFIEIKLHNVAALIKILQVLSVEAGCPDGDTGRHDRENDLALSK